MAAQKELKIPIEDLKLVLECKCGSEICIDFTKQEPDFFTATNTVMHPTKSFQNRGNLKCPVCTATFDAQADFNKLLDALRQVAERMKGVYFRIKNPD